MASAGPSSQSEPLCNGTLAAHARITGRYEDGVRERGREKKKEKELSTGNWPSQRGWSVIVTTET